MGVRRLLRPDKWMRRSARHGTPAGIAPYQAAVGRDMRNYWQQVDSNYTQLVNPFAYYTTLIDSLRRMDRLCIRPMFELPQPVDPGTRVVSLRHDIDADPLTALRAARYLARWGLCGSFFLLHSAPYYGDFVGDRFIRNPQLLDWIDGFIAAGCEFGVHNDALGILKSFNVDGAAALVHEIAWLRSHGAQIRGTVSHNSLPVQSAENFEIFGGRVLWESPETLPERQRYPLGSLCESALNLIYEGTFARSKPEVDPELIRHVIGSLVTDVRSYDWMKCYLTDNPFFDWEIDFQVWLTGKDTWVVGGRFDGRTHFEFEIDAEDLIKWLRCLPEGSRTVLVIHPVYVRGE